MKIKTAALCLAAVVAAAPASAITIDRSFTISNASFSFLNNFSGGIPSDIITVDVSGTVDSHVGAPGFIGQSISGEATFSDFSFDVFDSNLALAGAELFPGNGGDTVFVLPPIASATDIGGGAFSFEWAGPWSVFGPTVGDAPELVLGVLVDTELPKKQYVLFCETGDLDNCSTNASDLDDPVQVDGFPYTEGQSSGSITFYTGTPPAPVPLPAAGWLMLAGLAGLAAARRR